MILIYRVGDKVFKNKQIAELSAYLYVFSFSIVYQVSFYSENTFVCFSLLGFYFLGKKSHQIVTAAFFFGLASLTRTTGVLLSVFVAYPMLSKIIKTPNCFKIFKYLMLSWYCAVIILSPLLVVQYVTPYRLYCDPKIDRTNAVPDWCLDAFPNVYNFVQHVHWDNKIFGMLYRSLDKNLVSLPMFLIFFYIAKKVVSA